MSHGFDPDVFEASSFDATLSTEVGPAFDSVAFDALSFDAPLATRAWDGGAFSDLAFDATESPSYGGPAFDGSAFADGVFHATESPVVVPIDRTIAIIAALPLLSGAIRVAVGQVTTITGALPTLGGIVNVVYRTDTARPLVATVNSRYQNAVPTNQSIAPHWQDTSSEVASFSAHFQDAALLQKEACDRWNDADRSERQGWDELRFQDAMRTSGVPVEARYQDADRIRFGRIGRFQEAEKLPGPQPSMRFQQGTAVSHSKRGRFQQAVRLAAIGSDGRFQSAKASCLQMRWRYQDAIFVSAGVRERPINPPGEGPDPGGETVVVPIKRIYTVINTATLRRVEGNITIPTRTMSLSIDADSWTWGFTASVPGIALADLEPSSEGAPVEVEATINGVAYRALVEGIARERVFGRSDLSITGRGKAAVLDSPYSPAMSFGNPSDARTVQQLCDDVLTLNGVSIGWTVDWAPEVWSVGAGAFSHQGSYISALNAIAGAAGAYLQPHRTADSLSVLSRYPVAPWEWGDVTPDYELPSDVVQKESIQWSDKPIYNRVYVSGVQQGVNGRVTRTGTAGDLVAPAVIDPLIADAMAARVRAMPVLADVGRQALTGLRLPVLAETGIISPGKFVRYVDGGTTRIGIVRSSAAAIERSDDRKLTVWQTIGVETHVTV